MAKSKYHYYVLVFSSDGPVYVTSIDNANRYAHWDKSKAPLEFSASYAEDLVMGLNMNFNSAFMIQSTREIPGQPYNYEYYDCTFVEKSEEKEEE